MKINFRESIISSNFAKINFRESIISSNFAKIYFRELAILGIFTQTKVMLLRRKLGDNFRMFTDMTNYLFDTLIIWPIILYMSDLWGCLKLPSDGVSSFRFGHRKCALRIGTG